jgi:hypothetical protein
MVAVVLQRAPGSERTRRLFGVAAVALAITLFVSFVPLMHFRAVVIADFFCLAAICAYAEESEQRESTRVVAVALLPPLCLWYFYDVGNYIAADRLYEYRTWFELWTG